MARSDVIALLIAVPALIGAGGLTVLESSRFVQQASRAPTGSFAAALRDDDFELAFAFVRAGQDPNAPIAFRSEALTGGREIMIAPVLIAVAHHHENSVMTLMSLGVRFDAPGNRFALCLARFVGDESIADGISRNGGPAAAAGTCPETTPSSDAPLVAFVDHGP